MKEFALLEKKQLTHDVFELTYSCSESVDHIPGQFITFILPDGIGGRSYSLLKSENDTFTLTIKRVPDGKKGSIFLCDAEAGDRFKGVGPVGKFVLHEGKNAKLFAGTGTGIVPLFNQIVSTLSSGNTEKVCLLFGVRTNNDLFYIDELEELKEKYNNFDYKIALSREEKDIYHKGYITEFVDESTKLNYDEVYLCGAPVVVDSMNEKLEENGFNTDQIFTEKY